MTKGSPVGSIIRSGVLSYNFVTRQDFLFILIPLVFASILFLAERPDDAFADETFYIAEALAGPRQGGEIYVRNMADSVSVASYFDNPASRSIASRNFVRGISDGVNVGSEFGGPSGQTTASQARTLGPQQPNSQRADANQRLLFGNYRLDARLTGMGAALQAGTPTAKMATTDAGRIKLSELPPPADSDDPDSHRLLKDVMTESYASTAMQGMAVYSGAVNGVYLVALVVVAATRTRQLSIVKIKIGKGQAVLLPIENGGGARMVIFLTATVAIATMSAIPSLSGQAFADNTAGAIYKEGTTGVVSYREWDGSGWGSKVALPDPGTADIMSVKFAYSPVSSMRVATALDSDGFLWLYYCSASCNIGANWTLVDAEAGSGGTQALVDIGTATAGRTYHDIAFEGISGTLLIVYDKTITQNADIYFRTFDGTTLSAESSYDHNNTSDEEVLAFFKMASKPRSDEIALIALDDTADDVFAFIWDGSAFGNKHTLTTNTGTTSDDSESIGVAYETNSGAAVVFSGSGANSASYARWSGSWTSASTTDPNSAGGNDVSFVRARADPSSDAIMICQEDDLSDLTCTEFNSGSPGTWTVLESNTGSITSRPAGFAWNPTGNTGLVLYYDSAATDLQYRTFNGSTFSGETAVATGLVKWVVGATDTENTNNGVDSLWLMYVDAVADTIGDAKWDGTTFTNNGETSFTADAGTTNTMEVMALAFQPVPNKPMSDLIVVTDSVFVAMVRTIIISDTLTVAEAVAGITIMHRSIADSISVSTGAISTIAKISDLSSNIVASDQITKAFAASRSILDQLEISETSVRTFTLSVSLSESVQVIESSAGTSLALKSASDNIIIADDVMRTIVFNRSASDSITITDVEMRSIIIMAALSDNTAMTDLITRSIVASRSNSDFVTAADSIVRITEYSRTVAESVAVVDSIARMIQIQSSISVTISIADTPSKTILTYRSLSDAVSANDALVRLVASSRSISDNIMTADSTALSVFFARSIAQVLSTSDAIIHDISYGRSIADSTTIIDVVARTYAQSRSLADSLVLIDLAPVTLAFSRSTSDSIATIDSTANSVSFARTIHDTLLVMDAITAALAVSKPTSETLAVIEGITRTATYSEPIAVVLTLTDTISAQWITSRAVTDNLPLVDAIARPNSVARTIGDSLLLTDSVAKMQVLTNSLGDSMILIDIITISEDYAKNVEDTITTTDTVGRSASFATAVLDSITTVDVIKRSYGTSKSFADSIAVADSPSQTGLYPRSMTDTLAITENETNLFLALRIAFDTLEVTEFASHVVSYERAIADTLAATDSIGGAAAFIILISNTIVVTDLEARAYLAIRSTFDTVSAADTIATNLAASRSMTEALAGIDGVAITFSSIRLLTDAVPVTDTAKYSILASRQIFDLVAAVDAASATVSGRAVSDAVAVTDAVGAMITAKATSDNLSIADLITAKVTAMLISDTFSLADIVSAKVTARGISDELAIGEILEAKIVLRSILDSVNFTDGINTTFNLHVADSLAASDNITTITSITERIADSLLLNDAVISKILRLDVITEMLVLEEKINRFVTYHLTDTMSVNDQMGTILLQPINVADTVNFDDNIDMSMTRSLSDNVTVQDLALSTSLYLTTADSIVMADQIKAVVPQSTGDMLAVTDVISINVNLMLIDSVPLIDTVSFLAGKNFAHELTESLVIVDTASTTSGKIISINDPLTVDSALTNVSAYWNKNFSEEFVLGECTLFACNLVWHGYEEVGIAAEITPQPTLEEVLPVNDSISRQLNGSPVPSLTDTISFSEVITVRTPSVLILTSKEFAGPLTSIPIIGNFTYGGDAASLVAQIGALPVVINSTGFQPGVTDYITILRTFHVQVTPNAAIPGTDVIVTEIHELVPAQANMLMRLNFNETPQLNRYANFVQSLDIEFTPRIDSNDFGLVVSLLNSPPSTVPPPATDLIPMYLDVDWIGNFPGSESPALQTYYQNQPKFTFTVSEQWARDQQAAVDANGFPNLKLWLLDEVTNQWMPMMDISKTATGDDTYTFEATLPHLSTYAITANRAPASSGGSGPAVINGKALTVDLLDSLKFNDKQESVPVETIEEFGQKKLTVRIADAVAIFTKPVSYRTFQVGDVEVRITMQDVRQESIITPKAIATFLVEMHNLSGKEEKFTLNFWYYDQSGNRPYESSQVAEIGPHESRELLVDVPFTKPGSFEVTAEARSILDGDLINTAQITVTIPWLSINLYVLVVIAVAILGASGGVMAVLFRGGLAGAGAGTALLLLLRKRKPAIRVTDRFASIEEEYDIIVKVRQREAQGAQAVFDLEIVNRSGMTQEFMLKYWAADSSGIRMSEHVERVRIKGRATDVKVAQVALPPGRNIFVVDAGPVSEKQARWSHVGVRVKNN